MARMPSDEIVDAEFEEVPSAGRPAAQPQVRQLRRDDAGVWYDPSMLAPQQAPMDLAQLEQRARALSMFVKVPLLAYVALNKDLPAIVRLAALGLAALEVREISKQAGQVELMLPDFEV